MRSTRPAGVAATRVITVSTGSASARLSASATVPDRASRERMARVGNMIGRFPSAASRSAVSGRIQSESTDSEPSWLPSWPGGRAAR